MLLFHSQNVPLGGTTKTNHIYIQTKNTKKWIDLGELTIGHNPANVLRAYLPGNEYPQALGQVFFRFVGEPQRVYQFYANIGISYSATVPTFTYLNDLSINKANISVGSSFEVATNSKGYIDFAIGIPAPNQNRTCKVEFEVIDTGVMDSIGRFYIGDESRWLMYLADSAVSSNPQWGDPIPLWNDMVSTVPKIELKMGQITTNLYRITRPIYNFSQENIRGTVGLVTNPQNFQWRGGNDPDTYRQMDQGSVLDLVQTSWTTGDGYKLEINRKGPGKVDFTVEIPGEHPIAEFSIKE